MKIESGIPIPRDPRQKEGGPTATLTAMKKGDSVLLATTQINTWRVVASHKKILVCARKESETHTRLWVTRAFKKS